MDHHSGTGAAQALAPDDVNDTSNGNGSGVLAKLSKASWVWIILLSAVSAGVGGYYTIKQDLTVQGATLQLEIADLKAQVAELRKVQQNVVPRQEHEVRLEMQKELDKLRDDLVRERHDDNTRSIQELRDDFTEYRRTHK